MTDSNYTLFVAAYNDEAAAKEDFTAVNALDDVAVVAAVVLSRDADGKVDVKEHGGKIVGKGAGIGAVAGLAVGLFAPPLLLSGAIGAGIGAAVAGIAKHHEEKKIGVKVQDWLPEGSSALVAVVDDKYLDRVDAAVEKATKKTNKAIDKGDFDAVVKAVDEGDEEIGKAIDS